ncbi:MAG TPA: thioredoxin domain-containing protein [Bryobacteraceae bacterium]|jgi:protein-disulfide isomerase
MKFTTAVLFAAFAGSAFAQNPLESLDLTGFSAAQKKTLTQVLQTQNCNCGCNWTIAKCREDDPKCSYSRQLLNLIYKDVKGGMDETKIVADLRDHAMKPPPILDEPVTLNVQGDPFLGPEKAKVTIVEFSDFQCPYCAAAAGQARMLLDKFPNDVKLVFKEFPLDDHSQAFLAAQSAVAAHAQGKFWEMHNILYANYRNISAQNILVWAKQIGLDMKKFIDDVDSGKYKQTVQNEVKQGEDAGVQGTPSFFFNGRKYSGAFQADIVAELLKNEFKVAPKP